MDQTQRRRETPGEGERFPRTDCNAKRQSLGPSILKEIRSARSGLGCSICVERDLDWGPDGGASRAPIPELLPLG